MTKILYIALLGVVATSGCGETDILAIDRSKVVAGRDAAGSRDAEAADVGAPSPPSGIFIEAESGQLSGGFTVGNHPLASGVQFIQPPRRAPSTNQPGPA